MKITSRPMLQDLVKAAMANAANNLQISQEAGLHAEKTAATACPKCHQPMEKCACGTKSAAVEADKVEKLASVLDYLAAELLKEAETSGPPGVTHATASTPLPDHKGQGHAIVPMHPGEGKGLPGEHGKTQMENDLHRAPGGPGVQTTAMTAGKGKAASITDMIRKVAADKTEKKETEGLAKAEKGLEEAEKAHESEPENKGSKEKIEKAKEGSVPDALVADFLAHTKQAEDAINPAQIKAGKAVPPETSASGQPGGNPVGGAPQGPTGLVGSNESAQNYTRSQAYAGRKTELKSYFKEPALTTSTDKALQVAFEHNKGSKLGSAEGFSVKTAAARALLAKLADAASAEDTNKGTAATPAAAS